MKRFVRTTTTALLLAVMSACASSADPAPDQPLVAVTNDHPLRVTVDVVTDAGEDYRLGAVETAGEEIFQIPRHVSTLDVRFLVDPLGSTSTHLTEDVAVTGGSYVELDIRSNLDLTSVSVRNR
ncbi:MAG: hypothetical protein RJQ04_19015 [Longimicrobiales bacterium]